MGSLGVLRVQNRLLRIWHAQNTRSQSPTAVSPLPSELAPRATRRVSSEGHHPIEIEHWHRCLQDSPHRMVHQVDILRFWPYQRSSCHRSGGRTFCLSNVVDPGLCCFHLDTPALIPLLLFHLLQLDRVGRPLTPRRFRRTRRRQHPPPLVVVVSAVRRYTRSSQCYRKGESRAL